MFVFIYKFYVISLTDTSLLYPSFFTLILPYLFTSSRPGRPRLLTGV